jgi:hypothetical protein
LKATATEDQFPVGRPAYMGIQVMGMEALLVVM